MNECNKSLKSTERMEISINSYDLLSLLGKVRRLATLICKQPTKRVKKQRI